MRTSVVAVCGVLVMLAGSAAHGSDEACQVGEALRPYVDARVRYHRRPVADTDNANGLIVAAAKLEARDADAMACQREPGSAYRPESPQAVSGAATVCMEAALAANAPALEAFDRALARPDLQFPLLQFPPDLPNFAPLRRLAVLKLERAKARLRTGNRQGAVQDLLGVLRYARLFEAGDGALINFLVGLGIEGYALAGARWYAAQPEADEASLKMLLESVLLSEQRLSAAAAQTYRVEFNCLAMQWLDRVRTNALRGSLIPVFCPGTWACLSGIEPCAADPHCARAVDTVFGNHPAPLDLAKTLGFASKRMAAIVTAAQADTAHPATDSDAPLTAEGVAWPDWRNTSAHDANQLRSAMAVVDNPVGKGWILQAVSDSLWTYLDTVALCRTKARGTAVLLALRLYELRTGELPATLQQLTGAGILAALPMDPYADAPLSYWKLARAVWSAGPEKGPHGGAACGPSGRECAWNLPDAFGHHMTLQHPPRMSSLSQFQ